MRLTENNKSSMVNTSNSGIAPNEQGRAYTSPALKLDSSTYLQDSAKIAPELERRYPEPPLHLDSPLLPEAYAAVSAVLDVYRPLSMCKVPFNLLTDASAEYISRTRADALSRALEKYATESHREEAWKNAGSPLKNLAALVKRNGGPFVMGKTRKLLSAHIGNACRRCCYTEGNKS
jgi:glutathione S-transferase